MAVADLMVSQLQNILQGSKHGNNATSEISATQLPINFCEVI